MGGWTLHDIDDLDGDTYRLLIEWINDSVSANSSDEGSINMDAIVDAKQAKDRRGD